MSVQNPERLATKQDLKDMYDRIRPYMGGLPEVVANKFSKGDLYSTDEKMIGQWIDGKPLYQRVLYAENITITRGKNVLFSDFDTSGKNIVQLDRKFYMSDGNIADLTDSGIGANDNGSVGTVWWSFFFVNENNRFTATLSGYHSSLTGNIIIICKYTKTTDTAISIGTDTDYSTEEKIIGTWIDGRPVFQRTFTFTTPSTEDTTYAFGVSGVEAVLDFDGFISFGDGTLQCMTSYDLDEKRGVTLHTQTNSTKTYYGDIRAMFDGALLVSKPVTLTVRYIKFAS